MNPNVNIKARIDLSDLSEEELTVLMHGLLKLDEYMEESVDKPVVRFNTLHGGDREYRVAVFRNMYQQVARVIKQINMIDR